MSLVTFDFIYFLFVLLLISIACLVSRKKKSEDLTMYGESTIIIAFLVIGFAAITSFLVLKDLDVGVPEGIGQIGDFIGGITNPLLSFAALVILLRSTLIQTRSAEKANEYMREQYGLYKYENFRSEFYALLSYIDNYADKNIRVDDCVGKLLEDHRRAKLEFPSLSEEDLKDEAARIVVDSIEHTSFERFALAFRRAVKHVRNANVTDDQKYDHMIMLIDALTVSERIILLSWAYFYWGEAREWMKSYPFTRGLRAEEFIISDIYLYFKG